MSSALGLLALQLVLVQPSPLLSVQQMERLRERLGELVVEVEVKMGVMAGADPDFAPVVIGQAVCLPGRAGTRTLVTSAFLVEGAQRLRARSRQAPQWLPVKSVATTPWGLAVLAPENGELACSQVKPGLVELERKGGLLFSIDNPVSQTTIFWGYGEGPAEPPLGDFLLTASGLPLGGPLFSAEGGLVALNLRRYALSGPLMLAVSATRISRWLLGERREEAGHQRRSRRPPTGDR